MEEQEPLRFIDYFDSPILQPTFLRTSSFQSHNQEVADLVELADRLEKEDGPKRVSKIQKNKKIRTSRNVQKTYHNILKNWLQQQKYTSILPKYNQYYNQRVYFILVLNQILKHIDGQTFLSAYQELAQEVIYRKQKDIQNFEYQKHNSQQSMHLRRVIEEIQYSVRACEQFVEGNVMQALIIVYKRNQERITKMKQFQRAIHIFQEVTGRNRTYF